MATLQKTPAAQTLLVADFTFSMLTADSDAMLNTAGNLTAFNKITSAGDTTYDVMTLPYGSEVVGGNVNVITAVVGPTASTLSVGDSANATRYANAVNIKSAAQTALTITGYITQGEGIRLTVNNTVAAGTAGKVEVNVTFKVPGRATDNLKTT